jgi:histone deacetylase 11
VLVVLAAVAASLIGWRCYVPWALRQVADPREGRPLNMVAIVYSRHYQIDLGGLEKLHPFDIHKYSRIYTQLVEDGLIHPKDVYVPDAIPWEKVLLVHSQAFVDSLESPGTVATYLEAPAVGALPSSLVRRGVIDPFRFAVGGTLLAARRAPDCEIAVNLGGGFHHALPEAGEGFSIFADIPIAIRALQAEGKIRRALVIDLDVHQGNGTAECLADDPDTFTFSMHQGDIYPIPRAQSDLDVELPAGVGDDEFLGLLQRHLPGLFSKARPDIVFYVAGCDTLADDPLASLAMTVQGIVRRDAMVIDAWRAQYASIRRILETHGSRGGPGPR